MRKESQFIFVDLDKVIPICSKCKRRNCRSHDYRLKENCYIDLDKLFFYSRRALTIQPDIECIIQNLGSSCIKCCIQKSDTFSLEGVEDLVLLSLQRNLKFR